MPKKQKKENSERKSTSIALSAESLKDVETRSPIKKVDKVKRKPTLFAIFVKEHYHTVKELPNSERLKKLSIMYKERKEQEITTQQ